MAQAALVPDVEEVAAEPVCAHHWVIQPANGPESQGECQACGEIRRFKNYVEGGRWGDSRLNPQNTVDNIRSRASALMAEQEDFEAAGA